MTITIRKTLTMHKPRLNVQNISRDAILSSQSAQRFESDKRLWKFKAAKVPKLISLFFLDVHDDGKKWICIYVYIYIYTCV